MNTNENGKVESQQPSPEAAKPAAYQPPRILQKRSLERVTLASTPGAGALSPGGVVGSD